RLLVILDNCEHVISASAELVAELLQAGPNVKVIATSREALNVSGEHTYPVPALGVPEAQLVPTPAELWEYGAVRLFVARATSVDPAFAITPRNAPAIVEICRQLDGIPLALELAAARVRALAVESIAARLSDRFGLLARGDRAAIPRQQTLRALIDWSYDLLDEKERLLFRRLGVFAGGWTLEAVEAVGAGGDIDTADVVDLQAQLVDKSLVEMETEGGRYRMLSTVRQYALERLDASPDIEFTRSRHLHFYLQLAESASQELVGPDQGTWLARLDLERENLLTAHARCDRADRGAELGLRFVFAVKLFMINRGLLALLHRITVEALTRSGAEKRSQVRCRALHTAGQLACFMGRYGEAQGYLTESLAIARELEDRRRVSAVLEALAMAALGRSDVDAARGHLEEAIKLTRELGDKRGLAAALNGLAQLHRGQGALDAAEPIYLDVLALAREMGDREIVCIALLNLAMVLIGRDTKARVPEMLAEVLAIAEDIGSKPAGQSALEVCAGLAAASADWIRVARLFGAAEAHMSSTGLHRDPTDEAFLAPLIDAARQSLGERDFARANDAGRALPYDDAIAEAREWLGRRP
ncbi:MAG: tetratricopeptide repeat protein, partial [Betaproteobacteria bacterium]